MMRNCISVAESELNEVRALLIQSRDELKGQLDIGVEMI
jgi:hypothetical protein